MADVDVETRRTVPAPEKVSLARAGGIALLVFAGYSVGTKFGLAFTHEPSPISVLWPPNAILLSALLLLPFRAWPIVFVAAFPAHLLAELQGGVPLRMVLCWFVSNCTEALVGALGVRSVVRDRFNLDSLRNVAAFIAFAAFLGPFLSSFLDAAFVVWNGWGSGYTDLWRSRFFSNVLATLTLVPLILAFADFRRRDWRTIPAARKAEAALLFFLLFAVGIPTFDLGGTPSGATSAMLYLPLPLLLWAALRFGPRGVGIAFAAVAVMVIWGAVHGRGPFASPSAPDNALSVQLFLIFVSPSLLALAAVLEERESAERRLRSSEERFARAFRSSPDAMAITRAADGRVLDVNDRWQQLFGWRHEEALERNLLGLLGIAESMRARIEERLRSRSAIREQEIEARTRSGEIVRAIVAMEAVEMVGEHSYVVTLRDITAQRRAELEAREQRLELTHLSRVNLLGELSGAIAHELNQPLTAILSNADAAQRYLARGAEAIPQVREILQEIADADQRAARVIRRLRDLMRKDGGQFGPLELNGILEEVLEIAHSELITRSVTVDVHLEDRLPPIHGDRVQLQQLYLNLVGNACEAMQSVERSERRLSLASLRAHGGAVRAVVADGGPGIASEKLSEVFEPFVTSKAGGLGLGLAICRTIMTAHGGRIWAENGSHRGATIVTEFPARHVPVEAARP